MSRLQLVLDQLLTAATAHPGRTMACTLGKGLKLLAYAGPDVLKLDAARDKAEPGETEIATLWKHIPERFRGELAMPAPARVRRGEMRHAVLTWRRPEGQAPNAA